MAGPLVALATFAVSRGLLDLREFEPTHGWMLRARAALGIAARERDILYASATRSTALHGLLYPNPGLQSTVVNDELTLRALWYMRYAPELL